MIEQLKRLTDLGIAVGFTPFNWQLKWETGTGVDFLDTQLGPLSIALGGVSPS